MTVGTVVHLLCTVVHLLCSVYTILWCRMINHPSRFTLHTLRRTNVHTFSSISQLLLVARRRKLPQDLPLDHENSGAHDQKHGKADDGPSPRHD